MKIIVQGIATEYSDEGSGSVILMLHGWKDSLHTFDALVPCLAHKHRIVRLDMPGFGASEMPDPTWRLDDYVDFVEAFVAKLSLNPEAIVGHSFGGRVLIKGMYRRVFSPHKAILIASAGVAERKSGSRNALALAAKVGKLATAPLPAGMRSSIRKSLYESIGSDYHATGRLKEVFLNVISEDLSDAAAGVEVPTLLIWGENDDKTLLSEGQKLSRLIRGSKLEMLPAAGHFVHQEHPEKVARLIEDFV